MSAARAMLRPTGVTLASTALFALAALPARTASAQEVVEPFDWVGRVVDDATGQPLVGAFVSMPGSEWGSVTDERGRFELPDVFPGLAAVEVEQLGYETLAWRGEIAEDQGPLTLRVTPKPIELENLRVVADRFERRMRGVATSSRAFGRADLATATEWTALDFVARHAGSLSTNCGRSAWGNTCLYIRGRSVEPAVYIDEAPVLGGLDYLASYKPHELHRVEIYGRGRHIRVYTAWFMERAAEGRLMPIPVF